MDASTWFLIGFAVIMLVCCVGPMLMRRRDKGPHNSSETHPKSGH
ncbi:MAG: hypothetical protein ACREH8_07430 [Opitutaceae bacterium]